MNSNNFKVVFLNVRINNAKKRQAIFEWCKYQNFDIICLQETFCTSDTLDNLTKDWTYHSYHCTSQSNHSKGVSNLFGKGFNGTVTDVCTDNEGRMMLVNFEVDGQTFTLVNLYAPCDQTGRKHFFP